MILIILLLLARETLDAVLHLFQDYQTRSVALGVSGLLISTFGPIVLSVGVWMKIGKLKARWLAHLVFIPSSILLFIAGWTLFFYGADIRGDNLPGGYSLLVAWAFLLMTLLVHTAWFIGEAYRSIKSRANRC
jgi:ABC-type amino acid transport system permease subunit